MKKKKKKIRYHGYFGKKEDCCVCCETLLEKRDWRYKDLKEKDIFCKNCAFYIEKAILYGLKKRDDKT